MGRAQGGSLDTWRGGTAADPSVDPGDRSDGRAGLRPDRRRRARGHGARTLSGGHHPGREPSSRGDRRLARPGTGVRRRRSGRRRRPGRSAGREPRSPDLEISPPHPDIGFVHRRCGERDVYFVANTGPTHPYVRPDRADHPDELGAMGCPVRPGDRAGVDGRRDRADAAAVRGDRGRTERRSPSSRAAASRFQVSAEHAAERSLAGGVRQRARAAGRPAAHLGGAARTAELLRSGDATRPASTSTRSMAGCSIDFGDCEVSEGDAAEHGLVGPSLPGGGAQSGRRGRPGPGEPDRLRTGLGSAVPGATSPTRWSAGATRSRSSCTTPRRTPWPRTSTISRLAAESEARYGRRFRMQDLDKAMDTVRSGLLAVARTSRC